MPLSFNRTPGPGETRECTDPWKFVILRSNGDVCLCCRSPVVGNLKDAPLDAILHGDAAQAMRRELLTGDLKEHCRVCAERGTTTIAELEKDVKKLLFEDGLDEVEELRAENLKLKEVRGDLMRERAGLSGHVVNLETERTHLVGHVANLERELRARDAHVTELGAHAARLETHASNLERERAELRRRGIFGARDLVAHAARWPAKIARKMLGRSQT